jgi:membrane-bound ClpP family serine protease
MGQIIVNKNAVGTVGLGLFLVGIGAFLYSALDPTFGPIAIACIVGGAVVAGILSRRRSTTPHIDPRDADLDAPPPPIEPR